MPSGQYNSSGGSIYFSQDEEYLVMGLSNAKFQRFKKNCLIEDMKVEDLINVILIIQIGSLSEFFSGSPINVKAVLQLKMLDIIYITGLHMSRSKYISVIAKATSIKNSSNNK